MSATPPADRPPISLSPKLPTEADRRLGQRIVELRAAAGLSQSALGNAIGVTFQQVQKYEKGQNRIGAGRLTAIARMLNVPVSSLLGEDGPGAITPEVADLLAQHGAVDMLRAYAGISDADLRAALIRSAQAMGERDQSEAA